MKIDEIFQGLLMGDACIETGGKGHLALSLANEEFLNWLDGELGSLSNGVSIHMKPKNVNKRRSENEIKTRKTIYRLRTPNRDRFKNMRDRWYQDGKKVFPEDLNLTPTKAKYWYICDGSTRCICSENESHRPEYLLSLFEPTPITPKWTESGGSRVYFEGDEYYKFLDWIGESTPGFEYKWERRPHNNPKRLAKLSNSMTQEEMSKELGCSESTVSRKLTQFETEIGAYQ